MSYTGVLFDLAVAEAKRCIAEFNDLAREAGNPYAAKR